MYPIAIKLIIAGLLAAATLTPAAAQERRATPEYRIYGSPASPADAAAVDSLYRRFVDAWAREDTAALAALHAPDVEWINAFGRVFRGREQLEDFMANRMFPGFDPATSRADAAAMEMISTRYLGDDVAVIHFYTHSPRGSSRTGGDSLRLTYVHFVLGKGEAGWQIEHVAIMDAR